MKRAIQKKLSFGERLFGMGIIQQSKAIDYMAERKQYPFEGKKRR